MSTHTAIDQLPSLPQVLVKILDAIHTETADFQQLADIIRQDPAVTSKVINIANSSYFGRNSSCSSIERALMFLGTESVKTIVITTAIKQFFNHFNQNNSRFLNRFWRRSLISANFAQTLATLTSYSSPDEAYLCGLLTDVGQLILLTEHKQAYLDILDDTENDQELLAEEQQRLKQSHCEIAANLVDSWSISDFMGDAIRYHHEDLDQIQDAHHLVKIIYLSSLVSDSDGIGDQQLTACHNLFGFNETLTRELYNRIVNDIEHIASDLGIAIETDPTIHQPPCELQQQAHQQLGLRLSELGELSQFNQSLSQIDHEKSLEQSISRSILLTFGIEHCMLFDYQADNQLLVNQHNKQESQSALTITAQTGRSMTSDALLSHKIQHSLEKNQQTLSVIDRQLIRLCKSEQLLCLPLLLKDTAIGVLALGLSTQQLDDIQSRFGQLITLGREVAGAINNFPKNTGNTESSSAQNPLQTDIDEAIHEASNPLSIIRNYLEMLRIKLGDDHSANDNINHIKEEIDRVGEILLRLKDPAHNTQSNSALSDDGEEKTDLNKLVSETANIFKDSLFATHRVAINTSLDPSIEPGEYQASHLKQILTNLLKNACESLAPGDVVNIRTEPRINKEGRHLTAIIIDDNGPGIPPAIQDKLFSPVQSSKGGNHSGLGLSIVKKLVNDMGASISCETHLETEQSRRKGTEFQILIPQ